MKKQEKSKKLFAEFDYSEVESEYPSLSVTKGSAKAFVIPGAKDYSSLLGTTYRKNEIIVTFRSKPSKGDIKRVKGYFRKMKIKTPIVIKRCGDADCELPMQLWLAEGIDTIISANGVTAGADPKTKSAGANYSLNFLSKIPPYNWEKSNHQPSYAQEKSGDIVTIAVLDTGIDPFIVDRGYTCEGLENRSESICFKDLGNGWNFVDDNGDIEDDNPGRHGSLVTQFIINQFKKSDKTLKIIPLKTHDRDGEGDLFKIFCAVYYAIARGAKIINASWGFYNYGNPPIPQLDFLIQHLKQEGILFITAAGNQIPADDEVAETIFTQLGINFDKLRDLDVNQFLPACLSADESNLITVTTTDGTKVASTENYSNIFVDMGVKADEPEPGGDLSFKVPFHQSSGDATVEGSSFATAIATGIIGANSRMALYDPNTINKQSFISELKTQGECREGNVALKQLIRNGIYMDKVTDAL